MRVRLRLLTEEEGGRQHGIAVGYRASWRLGSDGEPPNMVHDAPIAHMTPESIAPGEDATAIVQPFAPSYWSAPAGASIDMVEGLRVVGRAVVLETAHLG